MEQKQEQTTLQMLHNMWAKDAQLDNTDPGKELLKIAPLHAKYMQVFTRYSLALKKQQMLFKQMWKLKSDYYNGRLTEEELAVNGWKPFRLLLLKQDIKDVLDADEDIQNSQTFVNEYEMVVDLCRSIIKQLEQRSYNLAAYIEWLKFSAGAR